MPLEDFARLNPAAPFDLVRAKQTWLAALDETDVFVRERPPEEFGCLYYSPARERFAVPRRDASLVAQGLVPHYGAPGGVVPRLADARVEGIDLA